MNETIGSNQLKEENIKEIMDRTFKTFVGST
jgi:hypothetical protein